MYGSIHDPGMGPYPLRIALAPRTPGWGSHTVRGGIDPGAHRFSLRFVGVVDVWKYSCSGDGTLSSTGSPVALVLRTPG